MLPHLPALRLGEPYKSLDVVTLRTPRGGAPVAEVSICNSALLRKDLARARTAAAELRAMPAETLIEICEATAEIFLNAELPMGDSTQSFEDYIALVSGSTGIPEVLCREAAGRVAAVLEQMRSVVAGLTRGLPLDVLDAGIGRQEGAPVSFVPQADALAAVLPSNAPGVNVLWPPAIALKTPLVLKPGHADPFTPFRLCQALIAAGVPKSALSLLPATHAGASELLALAERGMVFGDDWTVKRYAQDPRIEVHGPGRSKVLVGPDLAQSPEALTEIITRSITDNGGRSCLNATALVVPEGSADAIAAPVARALVDFDRGRLCPIADAGAAQRLSESIDAELEAEGGEDLTAQLRGEERVAPLADGGVLLLPTLLRLPRADHPLVQRELPFPFCSVVEKAPQQLHELGDTLVLSALTRDSALQDKLIASREIEILNLGPLPTTSRRWDQPHEGNLFELLYRRRALQPGQWGAA